jgi:cytochrome b561
MLVALHWLLALALVFALATGTFSLKELPNASPDKIGALRVHMIVGLVLGSLMLVRLVTRLRSRLPAPASADNALLNALARGVHIGLYVAVFAMAASGLATALQAGLPGIVFFGNAAPLPESFAHLLPRAVHGWIAKLLAALIALHVIGALYHQFGLRDRLMSRMWFGPR